MFSHQNALTGSNFNKINYFAIFVKLIDNNCRYKKRLNEDRRDGITFIEIDQVSFFMNKHTTHVCYVKIPNNAKVIEENIKIHETPCIMYRSTKLLFGDGMLINSINVLEMLELAYESKLNAMHIACRTGHLKLVQYLDTKYKKYENTKRSYYYNETGPMLWAIRNGQLDVVKYLDKKNYMCYHNVIDIAIKYGYIDILKYLLAQKINIIKSKRNELFALTQEENKIDIRKYHGTIKAMGYVTQTRILLK